MKPGGGRARHPRAPGLSLRGAARLFARTASARILVGLGVYAVAYRLWVGPVTALDAGFLVLAALLQPLTEWVIHVFVLHQRPRRLGPFTVDTRLARDHRSHHRDPHNPRWWPIPTSSLLLTSVAVWVLAHWALPKPLAGTLVVAAVVAALVYEWSHFLCHCTYRPRSRYLRRVVRHHRLHHFKNERYWLGVTLHGGDRLLGTLKNPRDVETSPTCQDVLAARAVREPR